ncbi:alkaline shock response membrane anchor protein AmaP [Brevibacterium marinum]|uniref:Membrane protein implicated in regulation of membrane protease activity n=1 Tax=Brevibacterium marinum TaxID=418643 RepID=A0A846RVC0_9MICO|nr:alkaline shock response membrane anchor protein AmaP [Brevibacterium marinum]NJC55916.1 membrane protein implicated in regulation of membrane protease activity [Brevibacterium marinum]
MRRMAAGANRTGLIIVGLLCLVFGLAVLSISFELAAALVPGLTPDGRLQSVAAVFALPFSAIIALIVAVILVVIGIRWLAAQIPRKDSAKPLRMQEDARSGLTTVTANVIAAAVVDDLELTPEIVDAQAILRGTAKQPELAIHVDVDERADIDSVVADIENRVTRNCSQALGVRLSAVGVQIAIARSRQRRQRSVQL